jgi:MFS transporter, DHA1 family, inner membrane transport protein
LPGDAPQSMRERVSVLKNPGVAPALWTTLLFMLASFPIGIYIGAMLKGSELARDVLPIVLLANGIGAVAASFTAGRVADALGNRRTVTLAIIVMLAGLVGLAVTPHLPLAMRLPAIMLIFAVQGYVGWGYWIAHCSEMAHLAPRSVTVAISLDMAALNIGMATAAGVGGIIVDHWGANALPYVGLPIGIAALVAWLQSPKAASGPVPDVPKPSHIP